MAVEIKKCSCKGTPITNLQDKEYGVGMRVMNATLKKEYRCTSCGTVHK